MRSSETEKISKEEEDQRDDEAKEKLPGFRFHPSDEELVSFYLRKKVENKPLNVIKEVDIYKYDPWDLPKVGNVGEKEWFFFCMRGRKYRNSVRPNRVTGSGFWKATGIDKPINAVKDPHKCVGLKKSLVYYQGHAGKGTKTDWMMHEFRLPPSSKTTPNLPTNYEIAQEAEVWTLCRIFKRIPSYKKYTPDSKQNPNSIIKSPTVSNTSSLESKGIDSYVNPRDHNRVRERKPVIDHNLVWGQINSKSVLQPPNFWNLNGTEDFFAYGNCWDELRSVVDQGRVDYHHHLPQDFDCI